MIAKIIAFLWWAAFTPWVDGTALNTAVMLAIIAGTYIVRSVIFAICGVDDELVVTDEKQWHQLEDHRSRLDGIDAKLNGRKSFLGRNKK